MRDNTRLRHEVAVVQRYLASLRTPGADHRSGRFARRTPAATADAVAVARVAEAQAASTTPPPAPAG
jgi:hypothetical protein